MFNLSSFFFHRATKELVREKLYYCLVKTDFICICKLVDESSNRLLKEKWEAKTSYIKN